MEEQLLFKTKSGQAFTGLSMESYTSIWNDLTAVYGLIPAQICEAASYSMAMVSRFALGLSSLGGQVFAVAEDCPAGWVALATLRHLVTAGARGGIIISAPLEGLSAEFELQIKPLQEIGVDICTLQQLLEAGQVKDLVESCHNILFGAYRRDSAPSDQVNSLIGILNESHVPVHAIEAPCGLNVDSGEVRSEPLFASSTLSLGRPQMTSDETRERLAACEAWNQDVTDGGANR